MKHTVNVKNKKQTAWLAGSEAKYIGQLLTAEAASYKLSVINIISTVRNTSTVSIFYFQNTATVSANNPTTVIAVCNVHSTAMLD